MKIVIDIPDEYKKLLDNGDANGNVRKSILLSVTNGTPLPKGHGDLISRKDLLKELEKWDWQDAYLPIYFAELVADLPSAEKIAEWIKQKSGDEIFPEEIVCSKCYHSNSHLDFDEHNNPIGKVFLESKYCPNCGARMKGQKNWKVRKNEDSN